MLAGKVLKKVGGMVAKKVKSNFSQSAVGKGIGAFRDYQKSKKAAPSTAAPAPKKVGSFDTGIDTNLKIPKVNNFGRGDLFKTGLP